MKTILYPVFFVYNHMIDTPLPLFPETLYIVQDIHLDRIMLQYTLCLQINLQDKDSIRQNDNNLHVILVDKNIKRRQRGRRSCDTAPFLG